MTHKPNVCSFVIYFIMLKEIGTCKISKNIRIYLLVLTAIFVFMRIWRFDSRTRNCITLSIMHRVIHTKNSKWKSVRVWIKNRGMNFESTWILIFWSWLHLCEKHCTSQGTLHCTSCYVWNASNLSDQLYCLHLYSSSKKSGCRPC